MLAFLRPLSRRLLLLVAVAMLPVALFAAFALHRLNAEKRETVERAMIEAARAIGAAMDGELNRAASVINAMAQSAVLEQGDLPRFYQMAQRVLASEPAWRTISLAEPSGKYLFNLRQPLGTTLPTHMSDLESFEDLRRTGRAVVTPLFIGRVSGEALFSVRAPVFRRGELHYVISAALSPAAMSELIARQHVPPQGVVAISDQTGAIVARSRRQEEFLGRPITPDLRAAIQKHGEGFAALTTLDGQRTYAAFSRSSDTGWAVAVGLPSDALDGPMRRSYLALAAGGALSLVIGVLVALALSQRIARPVRQMSEAAAAIGRGERPAIASSPIPELQAMRSALLAAAQALKDAESVREQALRTERAARADAEDASRRKDEFLAMLAHELRNPLGVVSNAVHLLQRRGEAADQVRQIYGVLGAQTAHLARLIDDLLEASRVMAGKIELERTPLDLAGEVTRVVAMLQSAGRLAGHRVSVQVDPVWVEADRHRLEQILSNLLDNALKYTPAGKGIWLSLRREAQAAVLEVRDEGIGMDEALLKRVFELFVQGGRTLERSQGGLGIGLTLVRSLVELHGGEISAHSEGPDRGSVFRVRLPALPGAPAARANEPAARGATTPRAVLIVEDGGDARATLRQLIELEGHRVIEAADGPQGVAAALAAQPDVAFIDLGLPGFDGYECARRIRAATGKRLRLVALTGYGAQSDRQRSLEAGFDAHLTKPVSAEQLAAELGSL